MPPLRRAKEYDGPIEAFHVFTGGTAAHPVPTAALRTIGSHAVLHQPLKLAADRIASASAGRTRTCVAKQPRFRAWYGLSLATAGDAVGSNHSARRQYAASLPPGISNPPAQDAKRPRLHRI